MSIDLLPGRVWGRDDDRFLTLAVSVGNGQKALKGFSGAVRSGHAILAKMNAQDLSQLHEPFHVPFADLVGPRATFEYQKPLARPVTYLPGFEPDEKSQGAASSVRVHPGPLKRSFVLSHEAQLALELVQRSWEKTQGQLTEQDVIAKLLLAEKERLERGCSPG
jgi:hypothetical protein